MKIYTRRGDSGRTGLFGGGRVEKNHPRIEACGAVDELNSVLGRALVHVEDETVRGRISLVQQDLFVLGAILATPSHDASKSSSESGHRPTPDLPDLPRERIEEMEAWMDKAADTLAPLKNFVLPAGAPSGAELHVARTICRRAERRVVALSDAEGADPDVIRYLNRLSDLLFTFARLENHRAGVGDSVWRPGPMDPSEAAE